MTALPIGPALASLPVPPVARRTSSPDRDREVSRRGDGGSDEAAVTVKLHEEMLASVPHLRAFAISLTGSIDRADDLVQEALTRGLTHLDKFRPGTCMQAWLFTILRNLFRSQRRRRGRELEDPDGSLAGNVAVLPEQEAHLDFQQLREALTKIPVEQREAILLVGAEGLSYEQAAQICGTQVGTIKSRVNRARKRLAAMLCLEEEEDFGPDRLVRAVLYLHSPA